MQSNTKAKEYVRKLWEADSEFSRKDATAKTGVNPRTIYKWVQEFMGLTAASKPNDKKKSDSTKANLHTISVSALIDNERLDIKKIIRDGIRHIPSGTVCYDDLLRRDLGVPDTRWREYSREVCFEPFRAVLPNKKVVWGKKATIEEIKKMDGVI